MTIESVTTQQFIAAPPKSVWEAITKPEKVKQWWADGTLAPKVGHAFTMDMNKWGKVACKVTECVPEQKLVYTFGDWVLSWTLAAEKNGTLLTLVHSGFDMSKDLDVFAFNNMGKGWGTTVLPRLADQLAREAA